MPPADALPADAPTAAAAIGHNSAGMVAALPLPEDFAAAFAAACVPLAGRAQELSARAAAMPKVDNEERAGLVAEYLLLCRAVCDAVEAERQQLVGRLAGLRAALDRAAAEAAGPAQQAGAEAEDRVQAWYADATQAERAARCAEAEDLAQRAAATGASPALRHAAEQARLRAEVPAEKLVRVRGDYGALLAGRAQERLRLVDRAAVDLERLREHLDEDALLRAARALRRLGRPVPRGFAADARIFATVRQPGERR